MKSSLRGALNSTPPCVQRLPLRRVRRPRRVAQREVDVGARAPLRPAPRADARARTRARRSNPTAARRGALRARARSASPSNVAASSALYLFIALRCTTCRLHGEQRRQLVLRRLAARALRASMPNRSRQKILEVRRERDQQLRLVLAAERGRRRACRPRAASASAASACRAGRRRKAASTRAQARRRVKIGESRGRSRGVAACDGTQRRRADRCPRRKSCRFYRARRHSSGRSSLDRAHKHRTGASRQSTRPLTVAKATGHDRDSRKPQCTVARWPTRIRMKLTS